ncbi:hypothetical protein DPM33_09170 [Mesorhizobium hawassense]|uniref:Uncharacterized protein n=1 Tax=Mesorhizobium hawassense TaxID=1209954 RepID=A0A330HUN8_9HYPH|nr:hypothetical protein DPM33_09170 [Mesorhizobium hawassense]
MLHESFKRVIAEKGGESSRFLTTWSKYHAELPLPALEIGRNAHPFVILGLDPSIHAATSAAECNGAEFCNPRNALA